MRPVEMERFLVGYHPALKPMASVASGIAQVVTAFLYTRKKDIPSGRK